MNFQPIINKNFTKLIYLIILLCGFIKGIKTSESAICSRMESTEVPISELETYSEWISYKDMCRKFFVYRPCIQLKEVQRTRIKYSNVTKFIVKKKCCDGYVSAPAIESSGKDLECVPMCKPNCKFSNCIAPNKCKCYDGYNSSNISSNVCVPQCDGCENGFCIAPEICKCYPNYFWDNAESKCLPMCTEMNCKNGKCIANNLCKCNENYYWNSRERQCLPICKNACINGRCTSPNTCTCDKYFEFDLNNKSVCNPVCEPKCEVYEICSIPSICDCDPTNSSTSCDCPNVCILNTTCPEKKSCGTNFAIQHFNYTTCTCEFGYALEYNVANVCYECQTMCKSLNAMIKNTITYEGAEYNSITFSEECENGVCISPGVCKCDDGYYLNETISKHNCFIDNTSAKLRLLEELATNETTINSTTTNNTTANKITNHKTATKALIIIIALFVTIIAVTIVGIFVILRRNRNVNSINVDEMAGEPIYVREESIVNEQI